MSLATDDLSLYKPFYDGNVYLISERNFTQEDYQNGNKVCLVSLDVAVPNGWQIGDKIKLKFFEATYGYNVRSATVLPLLCLLLCSCNKQTEEYPPWLYVDNVRQHSLNRFECTIQDGVITETNYVFRHPYNTNTAAGMEAAWKLGNDAPVYTDVERMEGNSTCYKVHHLPVCLGFLKKIPEMPPEDCSISIWMPDEKELRELLTENDYLIGRVGDGTVRLPETGEVPPFPWQIDAVTYVEYPVLFGVLLIESSNETVISLILLEGTLA